MSALSEFDFRLLFIAQTVSSLGNALVPVALAFAVLDLTGSAGDLGEVLAAQMIARIVFLLIGGVVADRMSRRALMVIADAIRGGAQLVLGLLLVAGRPTVLMLSGLGAISGMAGAFFTPAATGLLPKLVKPEHLQQANGLQQTSAAATGIAGPAAAGICVVTIGPGWALIADAATFFISVIMLSMIRFNHVPKATGHNWFHDLHDGWSDFWSRTWFRGMVLTSAAFNLFYAVYTVLGPLVSKRYYGGAGAWATLATAEAAGSVVAGLLATKLRPRHPLRLAVPISGLASITPMAFAILPPLPVVAAAGVLGGGSLTIFASLWQTSVQKHVPDQMLSRASSYDWFASMIAYPLGLALAGTIASFGSRLALFAVGGLMAIVSALPLMIPSVWHLTLNACAPAEAASSSLSPSPGRE